MEKTEKLVIKKDLNVTELAGEKVMIDFESGKYFMIKGVGNDIWDMLQTEITAADIIEKLLSEYEVTREQCETEVMAFLDKMRELEFI